MEREEREKFILAVLYVFSRYGEKKVLKISFISCLRRIQKEYDLGYEIKKFPNHSQLILDLENLKTAKKIEMKEGALVPLEFVSFSKNFKIFGKKYAKELQEEVLEKIKEAISKTDSSLKNKWKGLG